MLNNMKSEINIKVTPPQFRWAVEDALARSGWQKTGASYGMGYADLWYPLLGPSADEFMPEKIEVNLPEFRWKDSK
jgi:hypothetical protein